MKMKKLIGISLLGLSCLGLFSCDDIINNNSNDNTEIEDVETVTIATDMFSDGDTKDVTKDDCSEIIDLSTLSQDYTITAGGSYYFTGSIENHQIIINTDSNDTKNVHIVFENVTITHSSKAAIYVENAEKTIIHLIGENTVTTTYTTSYAVGSSNIDGAIHSKDDLSITGSGTLNINSKIHGIVCKNDLKITNGTIVVNAEEKSLDCNDSFRMQDGTVTLVSASADCIHVENDEEDAFFYLEGGTLNVTSKTNDCIDVSYDTSSSSFEGYITIVGGTLNVTGNSSGSKGIKSDGIISIGGGDIKANTYDDSIHSAKNINITKGTLDLTSKDDAIHSDNTVNITDGNILVSAHEGIEGNVVNISGGNIEVYATDDGLNASSAINVAGGYIDVTMSGNDVDGVDSNGSFTQTGGVIVSKVLNATEMAAPLDVDGSISIKGGTFVALGYYSNITSKSSVPSVGFGNSSSMGGMMGGGFGPQSSSSSSSSSSSQSFSSGTYTITKSGSSDVLITFKLTSTYSALGIASDLLTKGQSYILYKDGSSLKTWTQS